MLQRALLISHHRPTLFSGVTGGESPVTLAHGLNGNRRLREVDGLAYTYDYDRENRLTGVTITASVGGGVTRTRYLYDGDGAQVVAVDAVGNVTVYVGGHYELRNPLYYLGELEDIDFAIGKDGRRYVVGLEGGAVKLMSWTGVQWSEPITLSGQILTDYHSPRSPRVAVSDEKVHVVWIAQDSDNEDHILHSLGLDRGEFWVFQDLIEEHYGVTGGIYHLDLAANGGKVYLAWTAFEMYEFNRQGVLSYCQIQYGSCEEQRIVQAEDGVFHNHPQLAVAPSGQEAHLVWWAADKMPEFWNPGGDYVWASAHYRRLDQDSASLTLGATPTLWPRPGDEGSEQAFYPHVAVDDQNGVHATWYTLGTVYSGVSFYRYCGGAGDCEGMGNWVDEEEMPVGAGKYGFDLATGKDAQGTAVVHIVASVTSTQGGVTVKTPHYTKRTIGDACGESCWLTPTIDLSPLGGFQDYVGIHLATERDGRPQLLLGQGGVLENDVYYLDLTRGTVSYYYAGGQAVAQRSTNILQDESRLYYLHRDRLGSLTEVTDEDGEIVGHARYDAFGRIVSNTIPLTVTDRLYAYSIYDPDTGLYKIGARWYDPVVGVWLTPDALVPDVNNPIAWNGYAFNYQNPVNYVDPSGHIPIWDALDVYFFGKSLLAFFAAPGLGTGLDLLLDTADLLPGITGLGKTDEVSRLLHAPSADDVQIARINAVLGSTDEGASIIQRARIGKQGLPNIIFEPDLPSGRLGEYVFEENLVRLNVAFRDLSPELAAPVIAHELSHRTRRWYSASIADEVFSRQTQSKVWAELRGGVNLANVPVSAMEFVHEYELTLELVNRGDNAVVQQLRRYRGYRNLPLRSRDVSSYYPTIFRRIGR